MSRKKGKLIVISGPSGTGKGTVCAQLLTDKMNDFSVSMTTRSPREGEVDGKDYYFVTREEFERNIEAGNFLEHEAVIVHCLMDEFHQVDAAIDQFAVAGNDIAVFVTFITDDVADICQSGQDAGAVRVSKTPLDTKLFTCLRIDIVVFTVFFTKQ